MSDADANEADLKLELLKMDVQLRHKQVFWETPKAILLIVTATATIAGLVFGVLGYRIGQTPPTPIVIQLQNPPAQSH